MTTANKQSILAEIWRGECVESVHFGSAAVVDGSGRLIARAGTPELITFMRSSAKPFQAVPLIISGAADRFGFQPNEIAIACGSHSGEPFHLQTVEGMLRKIAVAPNALLCGTHEPYNRKVASDLFRAGLQANVLHNNCSGKHAGMLAVVRHLGLPIESYISAAHPLQLQIRSVIAAFTSTDSTSIPFATDGCGVPTFALSLRQMATLFARLVSPPEDLNDQLRSASRRIVESMTAYPEFVGGTGEFDTELMRVFRGALVSKIGAEGVWCAAVSPSENWPQGLGIALKIYDGSTRARPIVGLSLLKALKIVEARDISHVENSFPYEIKNNRGDIVGLIKPVLALSR